MRDALLDTTVFIDYYAGHPGARQLVRAIASGELTAGYSPITVFELWLRPLGPAEELAHTGLLSLLEQAELTASIARRAAGWLRGQRRATRQRLIGDAFIAATAAEREETIYTRNVRDFTRFYADVRQY